MKAKWGVLACLVTVLGGCGAADEPVGPSPAVTCGPENCAGCCTSGGVCMAGTAAAACGMAGAACGTCASHQACTAQACGLDPNQAWVLTVGSAVIAQTNNGGNWDDLGGAAPDPYVVLGTLKTPEVSDTYTPTWNASFEAKASALMAGINVQVMDADVDGDDPITPEGFIQLTETEFANGGFAYANWGAVVSIQFTLQKKP